MKKTDKIIKDLIQSVQQEIPVSLDQGITDILSSEKPADHILKIKKKVPWKTYGLAATVCLLAFLFIWNLLHSPEENTVITTTGMDHPKIEAVRADSDEIKIYYYQSQNKNRLIVWVQKKSKES